MDIPRYIFPQFLDDPALLAQHLAGCVARREHIHVWTSASFRDFLTRSFALLGLRPRLIFDSDGAQNALEYFALFQQAPRRASLLGRLASRFRL